MSLEVSIVIHNRRDHTKKNISLAISANETVKLVQERLAEATGSKPDQLSVVMCGRVLDGDSSIKDLLLGPTTSLIVLVVEEGRSGSLRAPSTSEDDSVTAPSTPQIGSFYVWCKGCQDISRGKLRVYCNCCSSTAVVVQSEPQGWNDVLKSNRIAIDCEECRHANAFAVFKFKCITCSELCAPLSHLGGNWESRACCICGDESALSLFDLGCGHGTCRACFRQYVATSLDGSRFIFRPPFGYTLTCPYTRCDMCVKDVHHFYVLGLEQYRRYQKQATEKLIALDDQGVFCPYAGCNSSFFWEPEDDDGLTSCPDCLRLFCRHCKSPECTCNTLDPTKVTIAATTKKCPGCNVDTERNGGCAHMHCTSCGLDWCFRCVKAWTEDCQWDHWFG